MFLGFFQWAGAQNVPEKYIKEKVIRRDIERLADDDMLGRPAASPAQIERATAFLEERFRQIGLEPLAGLQGYRQEFVKHRILTLEATVSIGGEQLPDDRFILVSEETEMRRSEGLVVRHIDYDTSSGSAAAHFFSSAFGFVRDTTSVLILVSLEFEREFRRFKEAMHNRFASGQTGTKLFVLSPWSPASYRIDATQRTEAVRMANVVGRLTGSTHPDEQIVFSSHYDHIGILEPNSENDSIANGADDDASGTTSLLALARYLKKMNTHKRTLIFAAFTAEELGGYGSQFFSSHLDPDGVVAMINIEMIGKPSKWGLNNAFLTGYERSDLGAILQRNLEGTPYVIHPDPYPEQDLFYRSDNATLARLGVPAHTISTDQIDSDPFYHTVDDEVNTLDIKNLTATTRAIAWAVRSLVEGTDTPSRISKASVRAR